MHADLTQGFEKLHRNVAGVAPECILRLTFVQQMEGLSFCGVIVRLVPDGSEGLLLPSVLDSSAEAGRYFDTRMDSLSTCRLC